MTLYVEGGFDVGRIGAITCTLTETGGGGATGPVSVASGTFFPRTDGTAITKPDGETSLALAYPNLASVLNGNFDAVGNAGYALTFDPSTERFTITATPGGSGVTAFAINGYSAAWQKVLGFTTNRSGGLSYVADRAPWYWIKTAQGIISDYFWDEEEDGDLGEDNISHDATVYGISEDDLPVKFEPMIPLEPKEKLWNQFATVTVPFTWQRLHRSQRNVEPILFDFVDGTITKKWYARLTKMGRVFQPIPRATKNWWDVGDVPIRARLLGTQ